MTYPGTPASIPAARQFLRCVLAWSPRVDDLELIAAELMSNANAPRGALLYPRCSREELKGGSWA